MSIMLTILPLFTPNYNMLLCLKTCLFSLQFFSEFGISPKCAIVIFHNSLPFQKFL